MLTAEEQAELEQLNADLAEDDKGNGIDIGRIMAEIGGGIVGGTLGVAGGPMGVLAGTGLGAEAGGQILDLSRNFTGEEQIQDGPAERTVDAAKNVGLNMIGQKVGTDVLNFVGKQASSALSPLANRIMGRGGQETVDAFKNAGIKQGATAGQASGNRFLQSLEGALQSAPGSAGIMRDATEAQLIGVSKEAQRIAQLSGGQRLSAEGASEVLAKGAKGAQSRFKARRSNLEDVLMDKIGRDATTDLASSKGLLKRFTASKKEAPGARSFMSRPMAELKDIIGDGKEIPVEALRQARTNLGGKLEIPKGGQGGFVSKEGQVARQIYGGLLDDLNQAAISKGALRESRVLDRYTRFYNNIDKDGIETLIKRDDKAFKWMMEGSKDSGKRISRVRNTVLPEEWDQVVASTVDRMGEATAGKQDFAGDVFSADTFLTNWNKLSPGAKTSMFGGSRYTELRSSLDNLGKVVETLKDSGSMKNFSNTAPVAAALNVVQNPVTAASLGTMLPFQRSLAQHMTNPKFVNWLAKGAKISETNPNAMKAHLARMPLLIGAEGASQDQ